MPRSPHWTVISSRDILDASPFAWCPGSAPMPKLLGLYALPPAECQGAAL
jgi:hypothetical protein